MARSSYRVRFAGGNGFQLAGIIDRPDDPATFPVAVFSHCFTCSKDLKAIVRISRGLAELGIGVLRYDMTGLGASKGDFSRTDFTSNVADVEAAVRFAGQQLGTVTALIGLSFGGAASFACAAELCQSSSPPPPRAVVTLAAPSDTQHLARVLTSRDPAIDSAGIGSVTIGGIDRSIRREMLDDFRRYDLPARISRLRAATLLFHSPDDETVSFDHALRIMGLIQTSPHAATPVSLVSLDQADHLLLQEPSDLSFVIRTTAAFLARYAAPSR